jgi:hypothetical protein
VWDTGQQEEQAHLVAGAMWATAQGPKISPVVHRFLSFIKGDGRGEKRRG